MPATVPLRVGVCPEGKLDAGESFNSALTREVVEETGLAINVGEMICEGSFISARNNTNIWVIAFGTEVTGGKLLEFPTFEHRNFGWFDPRATLNLNLAGDVTRAALESLIPLDS